MRSSLEYLDGLADEAKGDPRLQEVEIPNTGNPTKGYSMVFVKLVPVSGSDGGTVDFTSVSGLGMEGR